MKARRGGESGAVTTAVNPTANPFANITLTVPGQSVASTRLPSPATGSKADKVNHKTLSLRWLTPAVLLGTFCVYVYRKKFCQLEVGALLAAGANKRG